MSIESSIIYILMGCSFVAAVTIAVTEHLIQDFNHVSIGGVQPTIKHCQLCVMCGHFF